MIKHEVIQVSPHQFKKAFLTAIAEYDKEIVSAWRGRQASFTALIRSTFPMLASELGLKVYNRDYYTLDAVFYTEKDEQHFNPDATYVKYIAVALEHENQVIGSEAEINKLQLFNVPLKVLITYAEGDSREYYLDRYAKIIQEADVFGDFSTARKQLVIFGRCDGLSACWSFYVYSSSGFTIL